MSEITLSASALSRQYGHAVVVQDASFELRAGEVLGFLGPNGAGKSTTMRMLTGNLAPSHGSISICGIDLLDNPKEAKSHIGYLPETPPLYKELTVDEYITLAARLHRIPVTNIKKAVNEAKDRCALGETGGRLVGSLSKGFQQRVGIAQAIVHNPKVVILDEPTVGLDPIQIREIRNLIRELGGEHSVILSTHILPEVEQVCDRVQIMHHGKLIYSDTIEGLQKFRASQAIVVGFRYPPYIDVLKEIEGVIDAEKLDDNRFRIKFATGADATDQIVSLSHQNNWQLFQVYPEQTTLEDVFVQLTQSSTGAANP